MSPYAALSALLLSVIPFLSVRRLLLARRVGRCTANAVMAKLQECREREIIVNCASGHRSISATYYLQRLGFEAANLRGGLAAWQSVQKT